MSDNNAEPLMQRQFLRHCSVTIKNFKKDVKTVIGNEFEIAFEYFKTIDQTQEDDSGKVTIYGLSEATIALLEEEGGEIWLDCGYEESEINTLFIAYISRVYTEVSNNITATTIECSANLLNHFFSGYSVSGELPLYNMLDALAIRIGFPQAVFVIENIPEKDRESIIKYITTRKTTNYNIGDLNFVVDAVTDYYGLNFERGLQDGVDSALFSFTELGLKKALQAISKGYPAIAVDNEQLKRNRNIIADTLSEDGDVSQGFLLTRDSGLISSQAEYQMVTSFLDQKLSANERETAESLYKRNNPREDPKKPSVEEYSIPQTAASTPLSSLENGYVSNDTLSGLTIKPDKVKGTNIREATAGGQIREATAAFAHLVQPFVGGDFNRFTGFNDHYHRRVNPTSYHTQGKAFDFTIHSGKSGAPRVAASLRNMAAERGFKVKVDDEYNKPSSVASAPHIHVEVFGKTNSSPPLNNYAPPPIEQEQEEKSMFSMSQEELYGRVPIEINRRYNRIVALLNSAVKPQSLIFTEEKGTGNLLTHRVRNAKFTGNNKRGDWLMTLYCEDTESKTVSGYKVESTPISTTLAPDITN